METTHIETYNGWEIASYPEDEAIILRIQKDFWGASRGLEVRVEPGPGGMTQDTQDFHVAMLKRRADATDAACA